MWLSLVGGETNIDNIFLKVNRTCYEKNKQKITTLVDKYTGHFYILVCYTIINYWVFKSYVCLYFNKNNR